MRNLTSCLPVPAHQSVPAQHTTSETVYNKFLNLSHRSPEVAQIRRARSKGGRGRERLIECKVWRTVLPGCCPQLALAASHVEHAFAYVCLAKSAQVAPRHWIYLYRLTQQRKVSKRRAKPVRIISILNMFEAQADPHKSKCPHALLKHARSRVSVSCGGRLNTSASRGTC